MKTEFQILDDMKEKLDSIKNEEPKMVVNQLGFTYEYRNRYVSVFNHEMFMVVDYHGYPHFIVNRTPVHEIKSYAYDANGNLEGLTIQGSITTIYSESYNGDAFEILKKEVEDFAQTMREGFVEGSIEALVEIMA